MKRTTYILYSLFINWYIHISSAFAQSLLPADEPCIKDGSCGFKDIPRFIHSIASYLVGIAGTISVIMVMIGGYQWIMGGVSEDQKGKAKKTLMYAIIGLIITLLSWIIVNVIQVNVINNPTTP